MPTLRYKSLILLLLLLILFHLSILSGRAQGKITSITKLKDPRPINSTTEVTCIRQRTRRATPKVTAPMDLLVGDELSSKGGHLIVALSCGAATELKLSAPFRVRILANRNGCNLYHYPKPGGALNVKSSVPTNVTSGETRLASKRTQYEIKTTLSQRTLIQQWIVYEGEVSVQARRNLRPVKQGEKLVARGPAVISMKNVTSEDIQAAAEIYASVDASRAKVSTPGAVFLKLRELHQEVLADPANTQKQIDLATEQKSLGIPAGSSTGNSIMPPQDRRPSADIRATSVESEGVVGLFRSMGNSGDSKSYYNLAMALERSKWRGPSHACEIALQLNLIDRRLSETQLADCKRISGVRNTKKQKITTTPTQELFVENVVLGPNQRMVHAITWRNSCSNEVMYRLKLPRLPFVRLLSDPEMRIPLDNWEVRLEFDTTGMKPGIYRTELLSQCLNCEEHSCSYHLVTQINLLVTDAQP